MLFHCIEVSNEGVHIKHWPCSTNIRMIWVVFKSKLHCSEIPKLSHLSFSPRKGEMGPHKGREKRQCWEIPTLSHSKNAWKNKSKGHHADQSVGEAMLCKTLTSFVPSWSYYLCSNFGNYLRMVNKSTQVITDKLFSWKEVFRKTHFVSLLRSSPSGHRNPLLMIHSWMNILWCLFSFEVGWLCLSLD